MGKVATAGALAVAFMLVASPAGAELLLGADADIAVPVGEDGVNAGGGFAGRVGSQFDMPLLSLTPELVGSYHQFGGDAQASTYRGMAGLRLNVGEIVEPGIFAHAGLGRVSASAPFDDDIEGTAFGFDAGLMLELTVLPVIDLGVHGAYNRYLGQGVDQFDWVTLGVHANLVF